MHTGDANAWFWGTHAGAELDLMVERDGERFGFEFKCTEKPAMTRSLYCALVDLDLTGSYIVYPGQKRFRIHEKVEALPLSAVFELTRLAG